MNAESALHLDSLDPQARAAVARLLDENHLLRFALSDAQERLRDLCEAAARDPLTGLADARSLAAALARVASSGAGALLLVELPDLAELNARHGRVAGDLALCHVARQLEGLVRTGDLVVRRRGGFAILFDRLDVDGARLAGERISSFIADQPLDLGRSHYRLCATVAAIGIDAADTPDLIKQKAERGLAGARFFSGGPVRRLAG